VHRVRVVTGLAGVHVEASFQQQVDGFKMPGRRRGVQQRPSVRRLPGLQQLGSPVERLGEHAGVTGTRRVKQAVGDHRADRMPDQRCLNVAV
jgi:hypothetical protein